jgi:hypothetical protein
MSIAAAARALSISKRRAEIAVAAAFVLFSGAVVVDSVRIGRGWGSDGPEAGFYPFYVALLLGACAVTILVREWRAPTGFAPSPDASNPGEPDEAASVPPFVSSTQLGRVLSVLLPTTLYIGVLLWVGIYVASALFLVGFMRVQGKYPWSRSLALGIAVPLLMFFAFEFGFGVPLPKGPLEHWLGY